MKNSKPKVVLTAVLLLTMGLSIGGMMPASAATPEDLAVWVSPLAMERWEKIAQEFWAGVKAVSTPTPELLPKLISAIEAGTPPDLVEIPQEFMPRLLEAGYLERLIEWQHRFEMEGLSTIEEKDRSFGVVLPWAGDWGLIVPRGSKRKELAVEFLIFAATIELKRARKDVSERYAVPYEQLKVMHGATACFPLIEKRLTRYKLIDAETGELYGVSFDFHRVGEIVDASEFFKLEQETNRERYRKLDPDLAELLEGVGLEEMVRVMIWVRVEEPPQRPEPEEVEAMGPEGLEDFLREIRLEQRKIVRDAQESLVSSLAEFEFEAEPGDFAPLVFAELPKWAISKLVEPRDEVMEIFLSREYAPEMDSAAPTERAPTVWGRAITGSGERIAVIEPDGIAFRNPNLTGSLYCSPASPDVGGHATAVAGVATSTHTAYRGIAHGATLLSGNSTSWLDKDLKKCADWAIGKGAHILNNSWGLGTDRKLSPMDRYFDYVVRHYGVTVVKSAGNRGTGDGDVTSPGLGYNMITVGSFDDQNDTNWTNDTMRHTSSYKDPISPHHDREKPEVAAVGARIRSTTTSSPWTGYVGAGTSFAAPAVAGEAALLMDRNWALRIWPEGVKAIIMASAFHNIEGARRLSEKDGAGGIDITIADDITRHGWWNARTIYPTSFDKYGNIYYRFCVAKGRRIKATLVWDSNPRGSKDKLDADLDMCLWDPSGRYVVGSASWDNSYETVDVIAAMSGMYTLRIQNYRFDGDYEYIGIAWTK